MMTEIVLSLAALAAAPAPAPGADRALPTIVPRPETMELGEGEFTFGPKTAIVVEAGTRRVGEYLAGLLKTPAGFDLAVRDASAGDSPADCVVLRIVPGKNHLGPEGYEMTVSKDRVHIEAPAEAGAFYAVQTLRQLLPAAVESECSTTGVVWTVPCARIEDKPRYGWRGLMLDPGHNFLTKDLTLRYIDAMACYKMNRLHWHLTDMGWAIEIKKYPELTNLKNRTPITELWRKRYGKCTHGFYTQDEVREIVAYAAARHVTIVPEIEMPGHATGALACYPKLACPNWPDKIENARYYDSYRCVFCAGNEKAFEFLEDVLTEVIGLFPSPWIHIGGDECAKTHWKTCPLCQARKKTEGLKNEDELQSYFVKRIEKFLTGRGRRLVGWTEIVEGGLAPEATVQSWLDPKHAVTAAEGGHDVVMSTHGNCYLNYLGLALEKCYGFEPTPAGLSPEAAKHILGLEPCLWGFPQHRHDELVFPRLCAFAEVGWSPKEARDWSDFKRRLKAHGRRLDEIGINYRRDPTVWSGAE
jgi:hexosaminidase